MSFWKKLFGTSNSDSSAPAKPAREEQHNGYRIEAVPYAEAGQFQVAGIISKEIDGDIKQHRFVRADRFSTIDEAADFSVMKARQIIDQQGDRIFG
jgi:hypothetical protein